MGIPGMSGPFAGMPGGMPGASSLFPGTGGSWPGMSNNWPSMGNSWPQSSNNWPQITGNLPGFSQIFPNFSFNPNNYPAQPGRPGQQHEQPGPQPPLPPALARHVSPGAGAAVYDMAFVQDRSFRRGRIIVLQTTSRNGPLMQRCVQYSMTPVMQCQAFVNGNASKTYMLPPPANGPLHESRYSPPDGMVFTSRGRWRDMTVLGKFQYWPGWR